MALADEKKYLAELQAARLTIIQGGLSSYSVPGRSVTKLDLGKINDEINRVEGKIARLNYGDVSYGNLRASSSESVE